MKRRSFLKSAGIAPLSLALVSSSSHASDSQMSLAPSEQWVCNSKKVLKESRRILSGPLGPKSSFLTAVGAPGSGKTVLLDLVQSMATDEYGMRVEKLPCSQFLNSYISAIRKNSMDQFRKRFYRDTDVLLLDDIEVLGRTESTQEELFHLVNHYLRTGRKAFFTAMTPPETQDRLWPQLLRRLSLNVMELAT